MPRGKSSISSSSGRAAGKDRSRERASTAPPEAQQGNLTPMDSKGLLARVRKQKSAGTKDTVIFCSADRIPQSPFAGAPAQSQLFIRQDESQSGLPTGRILQSPFASAPAQSQPFLRRKESSGPRSTGLQAGSSQRLFEGDSGGSASEQASLSLSGLRLSSPSSSSRQSLPTKNTKDKASKHPSPGRHKETADPFLGQLRALTERGGPLARQTPENNQQVTGTQIVAQRAIPESSHKESHQIELANGSSINIGIETELLIQSKTLSSCSMTEMIELLAQSHNAELPQGFPRMKENLRPNTKDATYEEWLWTIDSTIQTCYAPWGLELVSPILNVLPNSPWRNHITKTWEFLECDYEMSFDRSCGTHIHVSRKRPFYGVRDIRRIASAAMWFEAALEAIVPESRRENDFCRGNYINSPGAKFGRVSRAELIRALEGEKKIQALMCLIQQEDRHFSWNFWSIYKHRSIEFRKPPPSTTLAEVLSWVEYTMTFVEAAMHNGTPDQLATYPQNVGGLKRFLRSIHIQGISQPERMNRLWAGHSDDEAIEPLILSQPRDMFGDRPDSGSSSAGTAGSSRTSSHSSRGYR